VADPDTGVTMQQVDRGTDHRASVPAAAASDPATTHPATNRIATVAAGAAAMLAVSAFGLLVVLGSRIGWTIETLGGAAGPVDAYALRTELPWMGSLTIGVVVGAVLAARRPRNPIPWLLIVTGLGFLGYPVVVVLVASALERGTTPAWAPYVGWVGNWVWLLGITGAAYLLLLFPNGTALTARWRNVGRVAAAYLVGLFLVVALVPTLEAAPGLDNPFGIAALAGQVDRLQYLVGGIFLLQILAVTCIVLRYVRSRGEERQQMKWIALAAAAVALDGFAMEVLDAPRWTQAFPTLALIGAIVMAVTRYRLYEIDRIVSRSLTYLVVTTLLAAVYVVGTVGVGGVLHRSSGGAGGELVVAASTLAVAALFQPLRRRVQAAVDRRFDRAHYDAQLTVARFGQRLRDEVDLRALRQEMCEIARLTVQPTRASVWLVDPGDRS
jgi:hypothetical protein